MEQSSAYAATIIIPAHNEAAVIGRLLKALPGDIDGRPLQVIVSCNGCTDDTAGVALRNGALVVEVETPSKIAALNAGDAMAQAYPRLYVDADIEIAPGMVHDLVRALNQPGALCAAPPSRMELGGRPWLVSAYFCFWRQMMLARDGYVGAGVYALSREGRGRFEEFPNVVADDTFVRNLFSFNERQVVPTTPTVVQAPYTVRALFRRRVRVCIGNIQLAKRLLETSAPGLREDRVQWWRVAMTKPASIPHSLVYASFNALARMVAGHQLRRKGPVHWGRDDTTRSTST